MACEISGEVFVSKKNSIWDEINSRNFSSDNKRGLSLQILFGGAGRFGRFKSNRMALWSDMTILVYKQDLTLSSSLLSSKK